VSRRVSGICALLLCGSTALAQAQAAKGILRGRVEDENGVAVAAARVELKSSDGRAQLASTDSAGRFELPISAPGTYHITLEHAGFFRLNARAVELSAGENELWLVLNHETEVHEEVEVTSQAHSVNAEEPTHHETLVAHEVLNIPVPSTHDLRSSFPAMPGVVRDNGGTLHFAGARTGDTEYLLDGFEIGDPATNGLTARVNVDSVRGVDVSTARYAAEYAHAGAGLMSLDTQVGDDKWRFGTTNFIPGLSFQQGVHFGNWYPRVTFSGPIARGRAWFSEAASVQHTFDLIKELPQGQNTITQWLGDNLVRAQFNVTPRHILQGSFLYNQSSQRHLGLTPFAPPSTTTDATARRYFFSVKEQFWSGNTLWELGFAGDLGRSGSAPQGTGAYTLLPTGTAGNFFQTLEQRARRWEWIGNVAAPSRHWHGAHDLSAGFNVDEVSFTQSAARTAIEVLRQDGTLFQRTTFTGPAALRLSSTQAGAYIQDSWRWDARWRLQLGLRGDWDGLLGHGLAEPRVALVFLPFANERAKFSAGWGMQYAPPDRTQVAQAFDQKRVDVFFDATGLTPVVGPALTQFQVAAGGLQSPRFQTSSVEWQQQLGSRTLADIHFINRQGSHGLAYENRLPGQPGTLFLLQNNRRDLYRSVEISVRHSFSERTQIFADYTRSVARSNEVLDPTLGALLFAAQAAGPLTWDAPNRLLSWGWAPAPVWGLFLSYFFEYRTGFPFSVVDQQQQLVGAPDSRRFPDYINLNLGVEKRFRFRRHEWALRLAVLNVTGRNNPTAVVNNLAAPDFLTFAGGQGRSLTARLRLVGTY
jgi:hypothetical protein